MYTYQTRATQLRRLLIASSALMSVCPMAAQAQTAMSEDQAVSASLDDQTTVEEIVVTAQKREQNIQDVPSAVTAISGDQLVATGASDISDLVTKAPGLAFARSDRSSNRISIRGLTSFTGTASEFPMVGAYVDEVPISENTIPDIGLVDLERVEVLRGPQGTLFGEGSMGGTIRFITVKPNTRRVEGFGSGEVSTTRSGGESYRASGAVNLPVVSDVAAVRVAGFYEKDGGFVDNAATGEKDADAFERYGVRGSLLLTPTDSLSVSVSGSYQRFEGGLEPNVFPARVAGITPPLLTQFGETVGYRQAETSKTDELYIANAVINYDFGFATLTSSSSYYDRSVDGRQDEVTTGRTVEAGFAPIAGAFGISPFFLTNGVQTVYGTGNETFAQEVRLVSNGDTRLRYTLGGYYRHREVTFAADTRAPDVVAFTRFLNPAYQGELIAQATDTKYRQYAAFGEITYAVTDALDVTGGLRYLNEKVSGEQFLATPSFTFPSTGFLSITRFNLPALVTKEDKLLYKLALSYEAGDDVLLYAQTATGFRPGGVNSRFDPTAADAVSPRAFQSDEVTSYEVGAKTQWLDRQLTVNLAAYVSELKDAQFLDPRNALYPVVRNAGKARILGAELEIVARPSPNFTFGTALGLTDAKFTEDVLPIPPAGFIIENGQRLPVVRDVSINAYVDWRYPISQAVALTTYAEVRYASDAVDNTARADTAAPGVFYRLQDYAEANLQIGVETDRFSVIAFVDNLFDSFAELGGSQAFGISRNKPRTIGARARVNF